MSDQSGVFVEVTAADGHVLSAYVAGDPDAPASIVVVQEIFGVNAHIRSVVDRYARLGYLAIAPALFDRAERGVDLDYTDEGMKAGFAVREQIDWVTTTVDVAAAADHVRRDRPVGVVGFCYGGGVAWLCANELRIDAVVGYYGGQIHQFITRVPKCPVLLHFGETDHMISASDIDDVRAAYPDIPIHVYPGAGHGFNCDIRASYDPGASAQAQDRTNEFLATYLGPR
jgi:carboxymethylenebutenolidase